MKYMLVCLNHSCSMEGVSVDPGKYTMKFNADAGKLLPKLERDEKRLCSTCGEPLVFTEADVNIPSFSVNGFKGLSDTKKKEVLRQRFDTEIKRGAGDEKELRKRNAISKMIGYDK